MLSSLKARLVFLYIIIMFVILSVLSVALLLSLRSIIYKPIDANLLSKAEALDSMIDTSINSDFKFSFSDTKGNSFQFNVAGGKMWVYSSQYSKYFFQIRSFDGITIKKSISLGDESLPLPEKHQKIVNLVKNGKILRILNYVDNKNRVIVQVAYNAENEKNIFDRFAFIAMIAIIFVMIASAIGGFLVSKKALKPLDRISAKIKEITEANLGGNIEIEDAPDELKTLINSFNDMLKRLDRSFKQRKRFISDVSHELKTPLSVITMQSEIILRKERSIDEYKKAFLGISSAAAIMSDLIEKMLLMARLDSKYSKIVLERVDITKAIENALEFLKQKADDKHIILKYNNNANYEVLADKTTVFEVFVNIIDNAIKYNKENGFVEIDIKEKKEWIVVAVKDSGVGIAKDDLDKIEEEFYRVDQSRSKETKGFGLGLSIVKKIMELHKGKIEIKSQKDKGTEVFLYFKKPSKNKTPPHILCKPQTVIQ